MNFSVAQKSLPKAPDWFWQPWLSTSNFVSEWMIVAEQS